MSRYWDRQQKFFDEIKETLNKSQRMYYSDLYFKKVIERFSRAKSYPADSTAKKYALPSDYSPVHLAVDHALLSRTPKARYCAGFGARFIMAMMTHLPNWLLDFLLMSNSYTCREIDLEPVVNMKFD